LLLPGGAQGVAPITQATARDLVAKLETTNPPKVAVIEAAEVALETNNPPKAAATEQFAGSDIDEMLDAVEGQSDEGQDAGTSAVA
jgi:hypothetical protein